MQGVDVDLEDTVDATLRSISSNGHLNLSQHLNASAASDIERDYSNVTVHLPVAGGPKVLPFEFKALEACLESAGRCLESEVCSSLLSQSFSIFFSS